MPAKIIFDKKQIYDLFVTQGYTKTKIASILGVGRGAITDYIKNMGWKQSEETLRKNRARPNKFKINVDKNILVSLYIDQNMTVEEVAQALCVSKRVIQRRLSDLKIFKDPAAISENSKRKFLDKYPDGAKDEKIQQKRKDTCILKYGVEHPSQSEIIKNKVKETCLKKFGVEYALQSKEIRNTDKRREVLFLKNGNANAEEVITVTKDEETFRKFLKDNNFKTCRQIVDRLKISILTAERLVSKYYCWDIINRFKSQQEIEINNFLKSIGVECESRRDIIPPYEIDLYNEEHKIGIEFNGTYWHCDLVKDQKYHQKKSQMAEAAGIRLIHIYEYEWDNENLRRIIKSMLCIAFGKVENRIYARNCEIREITNKEAKPFNEANHLQGHKNAQITYGLFYKDQLMQLMSFSFNKKQNWWEIERGCPGSNNIIVGGVSKLFKHFIKENDPDRIFSYCDFNKFDGSGYEKIGMRFIGLTKPDMKWVINGEVYNRNPSRHKELKENSEARIFGSGSKKYLWNRAEIPATLVGG